MADNVTMSWKGLDKFLARLQAKPRKVLHALSGALYEEGEELRAAAVKLTPVLTGTLKNSGHVQPPVLEDNTVSVTVGFGGPAGSGEGQTKDVGYAVYVHENLTARHKVGQAKYLEQPFNERKPGVPGRLARRIKGRLR